MWKYNLEKIKIITYINSITNKSSEKNIKEDNK